MPQFAPNTLKAAMVPITVKPLGLDCYAEIFLGPDDTTKSATSGMIPFISTGAMQSIRLPITMPSADGTYHVYIDIYAENYLIAIYQATEDIVIAAGAPQFIYASGIRLNLAEKTDGWFPLLVDIRNNGGTEGECTATVYSRGQAYDEWSGWTQRNSQTKVIQPGQTVTYSILSPYPYIATQYLVKSAAGKLLEPPTPLEYLCYCCFSTKGYYTDFATEQELANHFAIEHPEYASMPSLVDFWVQGLTWPEHFTKYGEDYGKIISWRAICYLTAGAIETENEYLPETGTNMISTARYAHFTMPAGWVGAQKGACGVIPNSIFLKLYFVTDLGWSGFLGYSGWIQRVPNGSMITFDCTSTGCSNFRIA